MSRRSVHALLLLFVIISTAPAALGDDSTRKVSSAALAPGLAYEQWALSGSTAKAHVARIAGGSATQLRVVQAEGRLEQGRESTSSMCARTAGCKIAVNGDFFGKTGPVGGVVIDGRMLRSPDPNHEQLSLQPLRATTSGLGKAGWSGTIERDGSPTLPVHGVNVALESDQLVLYTAAYGATTPACECLELVLTETGQPVGVLGRPGVAVLDRRAGGETQLEPGSVVLAGRGVAAQRLASLASAVERDGDEITITLSAAAPTLHNLGAHPILLRGGKPGRIDNNDPMLREGEPRTAVAWDSKGNTFLVAFDGRQEGGPGPTAAQAASFLRSLGATEAVLLDGGGSSTMAAPGRVLNSPSDGSERRVSNAVLVTTAKAPAARRSAPAAVKRVAQAVPKPPVSVTTGAAVAPTKVSAPKAAPEPVAPKPVKKAVAPPVRRVVMKAVSAPPIAAKATAAARARVVPSIAVAPRQLEISTGPDNVTRTAVVLWGLLAGAWLTQHVVTLLRRG
ncbi:MAG: phosphodiester glycosidase family protein [Mycobacteriales bacterium]